MTAEAGLPDPFSCMTLRRETYIPVMISWEEGEFPPRIPRNLFGNNPLDFLCDWKWCIASAEAIQGTLLALIRNHFLLLLPGADVACKILFVK